ncbi:MAG: NAD(P)/FAD-dependent oxidoreductase [Parabacteroides sp.]
MEKYDIIIVGSGLGGLVCGSILSKNGYKVLILEKNIQIGGCLQSFKRNKVKFETGMHYIGSMKEGQSLNSLFRYLSIAHDIKLQPLDPMGSDMISLKGDCYPYAIGTQLFVDTLSTYFPKEKKSLEEYMQRLKNIVDASPLHSFYKREKTPPLSAIDYSLSASEFISSVTADSQLQNVLAGLVPLYAGRKNITPAYIHAMVNSFYINGSYRIVGGSDVISTSLANTIVNNGGTILTQKKVTSIACNTSRAIYVETDTGERFEANEFISDVHPAITMHWINSPLITKIYRQRLENIKNTVANFTLYLRFKENRVPYENFNLLHYEQDSVWNCEDYTDETWPKQFIYMHLATGSETAFAEGAEVITYMNYNEMKPWISTTTGHRGSSYESFKQRKAERLLKCLEKQRPGIISNIEHYYTSTPLTYRDFTATSEGSIFGYAHSIKDPLYNMITPKTKVPNLLLTGQNINTHGILGVIISALLTCSELIGKTELTEHIKEINDNNKQ